MFGIGFFELCLFFAVALVVMGPEKLPIAARKAGLWYGKLRRSITNLQNEIETELNLAEARKQLQEELEKIRAAEKDMQANMQRMEQDLNKLQAQAAQQSTDIQGALASELDEVQTLSTELQAMIQPDENQDSFQKKSNLDNGLDAYVNKNILREPYFFRLTEKQKKIHLPPPPHIPRVFKLE